MKEQIREILKKLTSNAGSEENKFNCIFESNYDDLTEQLHELFFNYQTNSLLIAMLESQLKVERARMINDHGEVLKNYLTKELERQINELKG